MIHKTYSEHQPTMVNLLIIYTLLFLLAMFWLLRLYYSTRPTTTKNPPPSPPKLPIIGNLHQIGPLTHRSFLSLSQRYGNDLMLLHMGSVPSLVVSSVDSAREILQIHDQKFASRAHIHKNETLFYNLMEIATAPYGEYWWKSKKTIVFHLLSNQKVQTFSELRDQEVAITIRNIKEKLVCNKPLNLGDLFMEHSNSVLCRATFGRKYDDGEIGKKFKKVLNEFSDVFTRFYIVDSIPQLAWLDQISGVNSKVENVAKDIDELLEVAIEERLTKIHSSKTGQDQELGEDIEPFIDALFRIQKESVIKFSFDRDVVKALLIDSYMVGIEPISSLLEWVMVELLKHPGALKKLQSEVRSIVNDKQHVTDDDVKQMKYLKAVIMETARLHPPNPMPFPREATQDVNVLGFDIAKGTRVYVNLWAIGRDPKVWYKPDEFVPERFATSSLNFIMHDFKFIPFGAGRRGCPGRGFAMAVIENLLANLLCKFDWKLPIYVKEEGLDMNEIVGLASRKKIPLFAFATPFCP